MCLWACMFQHNSGTPGAISTNLGTHMTTYICKYYVIYYMYNLYIYKMDVCVFIGIYVLS
jgi:hypothetical protein